MHWLLKPVGYAMEAAFGGKAYANVSLKGWAFSHWGVWNGVVLLIFESIMIILLTYGLSEYKIVSF